MSPQISTAPATDGGVAGLRDLRQASGLTAPELAGLVSVSCGAVHRWERRERLPGPHHVRALADALGVSMREVSRFFDAARTPTPPPTGLRGTALRGLRRARGLSGARLGLLVQVPASTVYNWEAGRCRIPLGHLRPLAAALDLEPALLCSLLRRGPVTATERPRPMGRLAVLRARHGLSQARAAASLGVSRSTLRLWEGGERPPLFAIRALAGLYGVPTSRVAEVAGVDFPRHLDPSTWRPGDLPVVLRVLREWSGLTQRAVGEHCGATQSTVRAWENGRTQPTAQFRHNLERVHRLPGGALLGAYRAR